VDFEERVYKVVLRIPKGRVSTYGAVARAAGDGKAARAVGNAMRKNPTPITVPCHRVVRSNGGIGGYSKGVEKKIMLLEKEGVLAKDGKILDFRRVLHRL
jgi:methylated-DNA-[protein]-cysteine S-methyltransferase